MCKLHTCGKYEHGLVGVPCWRTPNTRVWRILQDWDRVKLAAFRDSRACAERGGAGRVFFCLFAFSRNLWF